jgi:hypothetical protein
MTKHEFTHHYLAENWRRTWQQWKDRRAVVAFAVLMASVFGLGSVTKDPRVIAFGLYVAALYVAAQLFIASPWAMWDDARRKIGELEERLTPRLRLVFTPDELPYLQELDILEGDKSVTHRTYRVGIQNDSAVVIPAVRVVLESFGVIDEGQVVPAQPHQPALLEHALNVMGLDEKHGLVSVAPGDRPTAFVDVMGSGLLRKTRRAIGCRRAMRQAIGRCCLPARRSCSGSAWRAAARTAARASAWARPWKTGGS